jgi:hypothetical protein
LWVFLETKTEAEHTEVLWTSPLEFFRSFPFVLDSPDHNFAKTPPPGLKNYFDHEIGGK